MFELLLWLAIFIIILLLFDLLTPLLGGILSLVIGILLTIPLLPSSALSTRNDIGKDEVSKSSIPYIILMIIITCLMIICYASDELPLFLSVYLIILIPKTLKFFTDQWNNGKKLRSLVIVSVLFVSLIGLGSYTYLEHTGYYAYNIKGFCPNDTIKNLYSTKLPLNNQYKSNEIGNVQIADLSKNNKNYWQNVEFGMNKYVLGHLYAMHQKDLFYKWSDKYHYRNEVEMIDPISNMDFRPDYVFCNDKLAGIYMYDNDVYNEKNGSDSLNAYTTYRKSTKQFHKLFGTPKYIKRGNDEVAEKWETANIVCYQESKVYKSFEYDSIAWVVKVERFIYDKKLFK